MKFYQNMRLKTIALSILCLGATLTFSSCNDDDDIMPRPDTAILAVFHGSPVTDSLNFYIDAQKVGKKLIGFGDSINYVEAYIGNRAVEIKNKEGESVLKKTIALEKNKAYSLFITNENDDDDAEFVQVTDDLTKPAEGKAKIRFVHISPDAGKLNFAVTGGTELFADKEFKSASEFKEVNAEKKSFDVIDDESGAVLTTVTDLDMKNGKIYTVWVKGLKDTEEEDDKIEARVYTNR